jgi:UDP-glucose 6-dehydrogenase
VERLSARVPLRGTRVAVLGTAFKEETDDLRASPGLAIADSLRARGADVVTFDPVVHDPAGAPDLEAALRGATVWIVVTGARAFDRLPELAGESGALLVDARRRFNATRDGYLGPGITGD